MAATESRKPETWVRRARSAERQGVDDVVEQLDPVEARRAVERLTLLVAADGASSAANGAAAADGVDARDGDPPA